MTESPLRFEFPREVGLFRKVVHNRTEFERYWNNLRHADCAYMSVYGFRAVKPQGNRAEYNTAVVPNFVLDFDRKARSGSTVYEVSGEVVVDEVRRLHQMLMEKDINHAVWFSGNGFHVWVTLSKTHRPANGGDVSRIKAAGRILLNGWKENIGLRCIDPTVPFDLARMIRIPNSYNAKQHVGRWSIPLKSEELLSWSWDEICERAEHSRNTAYAYGTQGVDLPIEQVHQRNFNTFAKAVQFETVKMGNIRILPCLEQAACQVGSNPPHDARFNLVAYLAARLRRFLPVEQIYGPQLDEHAERISEYIESLQWADYDPNITKYQVNSIVKRGYSQHCSTLYDKGFCLGKCQLWDGSGAFE